MTGSPARSDRVVYVGTYTGSGARGIYALRLDAATGTLAPLGVTEASNPSYLAVSADSRYLYAVHEESGTGSLSAFAVGPAGALTRLNTVSADGSGTTHVSLHPAGFLLAANYGSGSFPVFRLLDDGRIGARTALFQDAGRGPVADRQEGPHAHQIVAAADGELLYAVDLGTDRVNVLRLDRSTGSVAAQAPIALPAGSGPRHLVAHPTHAVLYVVNELASTVSVVRAGRVTQTLPTVPESAGTSRQPAGAGRRNFPAEIRVHPTGRFVYATNRGHDSVVVFTVDDTGALTFAGTVPAQGKEPRGMNIDPDGRFLYTANQKSGSISVFAIGQTDGGLTHVSSVETPTPVDVQFGPPAVA